jgi:hypothetical protein
MPQWVDVASQVVKGIFDILDLLVFRLTLLSLAVLGAYALIHGHMR